MNWECCSHIYFTLNSNWASHLLDYSFANTEPKSSASLVDLFMLLELRKIYEQFVKIFLLDSKPCINDINLEFDESLFSILLFKLILTDIQFRNTFARNQLGFVLICNTGYSGIWLLRIVMLNFLDGFSNFTFTGFILS